MKHPLLLEEWKKCIALIEQKDKNEESTPIATGFLFEHNKTICLITCKHVARLKNIWVRYNVKTGFPFTMVRTPIDELEKQGLTWCFHSNPDFNLAARISYIPDEVDVLAIPTSLCGEFDETLEGSDVFFLGFPLGITGQERVTPIVRSGMLSLKREDYTYLIEANAFPGSSGSPVFLKPSIFDLEKMDINEPALPKFIGVIHRALTYTEPAISPQTQRPRVTFEENAALAEVYSVEIIKQVFELAEFKKQVAFSKKHSELPPIEHEYYQIQDE